MIPLDTFGNPGYSNYLLSKCFLRQTRSSNKRWRPQTICSRASIVFIRTNPTKIQIYWHLVLVTQILSSTQVFDGIWIANIKYRILSNTAKYYVGTKPLVMFVSLSIFLFVFCLPELYRKLMRHFHLGHL